MPAQKRFDVCIPREYTDRAGNKRTHFWKVGTAFPFSKADNRTGEVRDGVSVQLFTKMLIAPQAELVLFEYVPRESQGAEDEPPEDDDIPL